MNARTILKDALESPWNAFLESPLKKMQNRPRWPVNCAKQLHPNFALVPKVFDALGDAAAYLISEMGSYILLSMVYENVLLIWMRKYILKFLWHKRLQKDFCTAIVLRCEKQFKNCKSHFLSMVFICKDFSQHLSFDQHLLMQSCVA